MRTFSFLWRTGSCAECDWGLLRGTMGTLTLLPLTTINTQLTAQQRKSTIIAVSWSTLLLEKGKMHTKHLWVLLRKGCAAIHGDVVAERRHCSLYLCPRHISSYIWERKDATGVDFSFLLFLWFKQCRSWRRANQLIPLSAAIMQGCILCAVSPSQTHCAQSFGALFPTLVSWQRCTQLYFPVHSQYLPTCKAILFY